MRKQPKIYIIAGSNGVGKTTFAREFLPRYARCPQFVNADMIARGLSPFLPEDAAFKAGRLLLERIRSLAKTRCDFGFETTLSGKAYLPLLKELKKSGYSIHLFFIWIRNINMAIQRIRGRVRMGGHHVPDDVVRRRFHRGLGNLYQLYRPLLDSWLLFDGSSRSPYLIASEENDYLRIEDPQLYGKVIKSKRS